MSSMPAAKDLPDPQEKLVFWSAYGTMAAAEACLRDILRDARYAEPLRLERFGHKVYSQNDEDGILQEIFRRIGARSRRFVEIGVESGVENNTLALLYSGWRGLWIEAQDSYLAAIRERFPRWLGEGRLALKGAIVTAENLNGILRAAGMQGEIDLLSVDIDGNDYYLLESLAAVEPRVVVVEYNARFAPPIRWRIAYEPEFRWSGSDHCGASLETLNDLMAKKGYALVGCNITGVNAFFVRRDLAQGKFQEPFSAANHFQPARYFLTHAYFNSAGGHPADPRDDGIAG
jgi:hypothetical protein